MAKIIINILNRVEEVLIRSFSELFLKLADGVGTTEQICPLFFYEPKKPEEEK